MTDHKPDQRNERPFIPTDLQLYEFRTNSITLSNEDRERIAKFLQDYPYQNAFATKTRDRIDEAWAKAEELLAAEEAAEKAKLSE